MQRRPRKPVESLLPLEGGRSYKTRARSFVDGISFLESKGWPEGQFGSVRVRTINLPSGDAAHIVVILTGAPGELSITLPTCSTIRAADTHRDKRTYDPSDFDEAIVDHDGNVTLCNGLHLHGCEVIPVKLPIEWEPRRHEVINQAIAFMSAEQECFFEVEVVPEERWAGYLPALAPDNDPIFAALDRGKIQLICYGAVRTLNMEAEKFEAFVAFHAAHTPEGRQLSRQTLATILRGAGMRLPLSETRNQ